VANGRTYLDDGLSFEQIAARMFEGTTVISSRIEPYEKPPPGERKKDGHQVIFVIRVAPEICDLLYNAQDGMRGRYWQSPDYGFAATKHLIHGLLPKLTSFAQEPPAPPKQCAPMNVETIKASLEGLSAKVWPREKDDQGNPILVEGDQYLMVPRWRENEKLAEINQGFWRRSPTTGDLEVKGALIRTRDQTEYIPEKKRDRSCQIHKFGFT